jgi:hypothetical protein
MAGQFGGVGHGLFPLCKDRSIQLNKEKKQKSRAVERGTKILSLALSSPFLRFSLCQMFHCQALFTIRQCHILIWELASEWITDHQGNERERRHTPSSLDD